MSAGLSANRSLCARVEAELKKRPLLCEYPEAYRDFVKAEKIYHKKKELFEREIEALKRDSAQSGAKLVEYHQAFKALESSYNERRAQLQALEEEVKVLSEKKAVATDSYARLEEEYKELLAEIDAKEGLKSVVQDFGNKYSNPAVKAVDELNALLAALGIKQKARIDIKIPHLDLITDRAFEEMNARRDAYVGRLRSFMGAREALEEEQRRLEENIAKHTQDVNLLQKQCDRMHQGGGTPAKAGKCICRTIAASGRDGSKTSS